MVGTTFTGPGGGSSHAGGAMRMSNGWSTTRSSTWSSLTQRLRFGVTRYLT